MPFYNFSSRVLSWPYYRGLRPWAAKGQDMKNHWLDQSHPSFQGRPA
jgi:hypothetical protein